MAAKRWWYSGNPIQTKILVVVFVSMLFPMITMTICFWFLFRWFVDNFSLLPVAVYQSLMSIFNQLKFFWGFSLVLIFIVMLLWSLYISNRLVGPIDRLERDLDNILTGNDNLEIKVRDKDDLRGIADRINLMVAENRKRKSTA
ncbi:MAG: hypothetical protein QNI95_14685 [Desulfobacterales bacterium]|nr:hypothetical protein [Desulfobacterales bacterium]